MKKLYLASYMHKLRVQQTLLCILGRLKMQSGCYKYTLYIQMVTALDTCSNWDNFILVQTAHLAWIQLTCMYMIVVICIAMTAMLCS